MPRKKNSSKKLREICLLFWEKKMTLLLYTFHSQRLDILFVKVVAVQVFVLYSVILFFLGQAGFESQKENKIQPLLLLSLLSRRLKRIPRLPTPDLMTLRNPKWNKTPLNEPFLFHASGARQIGGV